MSSDGMFARLDEQLNQREPNDAPLTMSDLLDLPDEQRTLMRHVLRADTSLSPMAAAEGLGWTLGELQRVLGDLSLIGIVEVRDDRITVAPMHRTSRTAPGGLWGKLSDL